MKKIEIFGHRWPDKKTGTQPEKIFGYPGLPGTGQTKKIRSRWVPTKCQFMPTPVLNENIFIFCYIKIIIFIN